MQEEEEKLAQAEKELGVAEDKTSEEKIEGKKTDKKEKEKTVQEKKQKSKDVSKSSGPKFYVIAGCFQVEKNADKYAQKLRKKGFQDAEKFGKHKNMHAVCYTSHNNMQDALQSLKEIRASQEPNAWLLKQ